MHVGASGALSPAPLGRSESPLRRERESGERENEARVCATGRSAVLFGRERRAAIGLRWTAHRHRTEIQPRRGESFPAQAQVEAWSARRAERERAGGPFLGCGPFAGRERGEVSREWAAGRFLASGRFPGRRAQ